MENLWNFLQKAGVYFGVYLNLSHQAVFYFVWAGHLEGSDDIFH